MKNFLDTYITKFGWMVEITDNRYEADLLALIYGFSQDGQSEFTGSLKYIEKWLQCSRATAIRTAASLTEKGILIKNQHEINGVTHNRYRVNLKEISDRRGSVTSTPPVSQRNGGGITEKRGGGITEQPNNTIIDNTKDRDKESPFPSFKSNCTLSSPICEKTGRMLYEDVYLYLIKYLKENQHFVDGVRDRTRYKGEMAPILKKYLEYEQRQDEIYKIYPRTKEHEFNRWLSKILSGWQNFITNRIKWDKEKQPERTETRFKDISTV